MSFLFPGFLIALTAIAIPLIIHLLRFRPVQTLRFSDIRFLENVVAESSRMKNLRNWLLLLLRILAIVMIVLAFSQPFLRENEEVSSALELNENGFVIFLDASLSMTAIKGDQSLWNSSRNKVTKWLEQLPDGSSIRVIDESGNISSELSPSLASDRLLQMSPRLNSATAQSIYQKWKLESNKDQLLLISDLQKASIEPLLQDSASNGVFLLATSNETQIQNLSIDSVWGESPFTKSGLSKKITAQLTNHSSEPANTNIELIQNGRSQTFKQLEFEGNQVLNVDLEFVPDISGNAIIKIQDKGFQFDNEFYLSWAESVRPKIWIQDIGESEIDWLSIYIEDSYDLVVSSTSNGTNNELIFSSDLIILADWEQTDRSLEVIEQANQNGTPLLIWPDADGELPSFLARELVTSQIDTGIFRAANVKTDQTLFQGVFDKLPENANLPVDQKRIKLPATANFFPLIEYEDGFIQLGILKKERFEIMLFSASLAGNWGDWKSDPLIIPILINSSWLNGNQSKLYLQASELAEWKVKSSLTKGETVELLSPNGEKFIPQQQNTFGNVEIQYSREFGQQGVYTVEYENDTLSKIAVNSTSKESESEFLIEEDIPLSWQQRMIELEEIMSHFNSSNQSSIWPFFGWAGLFLLIFESLISRFVTKGRRKDA